MSEITSKVDELISSYRRAWKALYPGDDVPSVVKWYRRDTCRISIHSKSGVGDSMTLDHFRSRIHDMLHWAEQARRSA